MKMIRLLKMKNRANVEFFTNTAVAWFTAGVIAPLFNWPKSLAGFLLCFLAILCALAFMAYANYLENKE
jgi:membrane-anchored protein YejM (alkaline phosphatase superfamily)